MNSTTQASLLEKLEKYGWGDTAHKIKVDFRGVALQIEGKPSAANPTLSSSIPTTPLATVPAAISGYDVGDLAMLQGARS